MPDTLDHFTGRPTRAAWAQDQAAGNDTFARGTGLRLMVRDGSAGEERALTGARNVARPLIAPRGDRVVFTDRNAGAVYVVPWVGGEPRKVAAGFGLAVWRDRSTGRDWVYVGRGDPAEAEPAYESIERVDLDRPATSELVWDLRPVAEDNVQLSADGRKASGMFPWPMCGIADFRNRSLQRTGLGCWPAMAPDASYRTWIFSDDHRTLTILGPGLHSTIDVSRAPGVDGGEVYHPRWTNHPRYFVVTGPYASGERGNRIRAGGRMVDVYLGRFDERFTTVEAWRRVTHNDRADFYPDVWIGDGPARE